MEQARQNAITALINCQKSIKVISHDVNADLYEITCVIDQELEKMIDDYRILDEVMVIVQSSSGRIIAGGILRQ